MFLFFQNYAYTVINTLLNYYAFFYRSNNMWNENVLFCMYRIVESTICKVEWSKYISIKTPSKEHRSIHLLSTAVIDTSYLFVYILSVCSKQYIVVIVNDKCISLLLYLWRKHWKRQRWWQKSKKNQQTPDSSK